MAREAEQGAETPAVVPGYGEADAEAASMNKAAAGASPPVPDAAAKVVPDDAGPVGHGTAEVDVKARIAEAAARQAAKQGGG